jgi:hypothetical protein
LGLAATCSAPAASSAHIKIPTRFLLTITVLPNDYRQPHEQARRLLGGCLNCIGKDDVDLVAPDEWRSLSSASETPSIGSPISAQRFKPPP